MRHLIIFISFLFTSITMFATGQEGDIIVINGERWLLLGKPINTDSLLYNHLKSVLPKNRSYSTANWDGYTAYWSIVDETLRLDSVSCEFYDAKTRKYRGESIHVDTLDRVFEKHTDGRHIVASWYSGDIRVARGKQIYYQHMGFERNYEEERFFSISCGKVSNTKTFHNYVLEGFAFDTFRPKDKSELRKMFPLHIENYPELANVKRIIFSIRQARVDAQGNLVECEVKVFKPGDNQRLAAEIAELLKAYHPWRVSFINGEFRANGISGYTIQYSLDE